MGSDEFNMSDFYEMTPIDLGDQGGQNDPPPVDPQEPVDPLAGVDPDAIIHPPGILPIDQNTPPAGDPPPTDPPAGDPPPGDPPAGDDLKMGDVDPNAAPPAGGGPDYAGLANRMVKDNFITEVPEGVNVEEFNEQDFWKTVEHNLALQRKAAVEADRSQLVSALSPMMQDLMAFNLNQQNVTDDDMRAYIQSRLSADQVSNWTPETHAEQIVREYYAGQNWTQEEIDQEVVNLTAAEQLQQKAVVLKPKLDAQASAILDSKRRDQDAIRQREAAQYNDLQKRTVAVLRSGKLNDIPLTREDASIIYNAVLNQDIDVPVRGGRTVKMGAFEAMLYKHRYDAQNGDLNNLMLAALVLEKGEAALEKYFGRKAQSAVTEEIFKSAKASASRKAGNTPRQTNQRGKGGLFKLKFG